MSNALTWFNDSNAVVKRVYYAGNSTIYEGMPLFYDFKALKNWTGYGAATAGVAMTEQNVTAEGEQNEGKYIRVVDAVNVSTAGGTATAGVIADTEFTGAELPGVGTHVTVTGTNMTDGVYEVTAVSDGVSITIDGRGADVTGTAVTVVHNNVHQFAGVVAGTGCAGQTGPCPLDIFIPNGAVVPVRCDVDTTAGSTVLCVAAGQQEFGCSSGSAASMPVAIAMETETGLDGTAGITLAKLDPKMFLYNTGSSTALDLGLGYTHTDQYVTSAITTQFLPFQVRSELTGTGAGGMIGAKFTTENSGTACVGDVYGLWSQAAVLASGAISSTGKLVGMWAKTHTATTAGTIACPIYGLQVSMYNGVACTGLTAMMYFDEGTAVGETADYFFATYNSGPTSSCAYTADTTCGADDKLGVLKVRVRGTDMYINLYSDTKS